MARKARAWPMISSMGVHARSRLHAETIGIAMPAQRFGFESQTGFRGDWDMGRPPGAVKFGRESNTGNGDKLIKSGMETRKKKPEASTRYKIIDKTP